MNRAPPIPAVAPVKTSRLTAPPTTARALPHAPLGHTSATVRPQASANGTAAEPIAAPTNANQAGTTSPRIHPRVSLHQRHHHRANPRRPPALPAVRSWAEFILASLLLRGTHLGSLPNARPGFRFSVVPLLPRGSLAPLLGAGGELLLHGILRHLGPHLKTQLGRAI